MMYKFSIFIFDCLLLYSIDILIRMGAKRVKCGEYKIN